MRTVRAHAARILATAGLALALLAVSHAHAVDELDYGLQESRLARIEIHGNQAFSDTELKTILRLEEPNWRHPLRVASYRPDVIDSRLRLVRNFYRQHGYHDATAALDSVSTLPERGDVLHIRVVEGPFTTIGGVHFVDPGLISERDLRATLVLVEGQPAPADLNGYGQDIYRMRSLYWDRAYLQVRIEPAMTIRPTASPDRFSADVTYTIAPGPAYHVSRIDISGNRTTKTRLIARELEIATGDLFAWRKVEVSRQRLLATALFRDVNAVPADWDSVNARAALEIRVTERRPAFWELGAGIGSRERIRALVGWGHNNLWGTGRRLQVRMRGYWNVEDIINERRAFHQGDLNYRGDVLYRTPHLLGGVYPLDINVFARRETRGESALIQNVQGITVGTSRESGLRVTNRLDFRLRRVKPELHPIAPDSLRERFIEANVTQTQTRSLLHSLFMDARDNPFDPARGHYLTTQEEVAGGVIGGDNSFLKISGSYQAYTRVLGGVLAVRARIGAVRPYGKSRKLGANGVPYDDRFFAGGAFTVRGYRDNSLGPQLVDQAELDAIGFGSDVPLPNNPARGGNYQLITNVEWRFPLPLLSRWNLASAVFLDGGNVWENLGDLRWKAFRLTSDPGDPNEATSTKIWDYRYSIGTGLRLNTPFGPFRVDVGWPLKRARYESLTQTFVDDRWRAHFSLGYAF